MKGGKVYETLLNDRIYLLTRIMKWLCLKEDTRERAGEKEELTGN